MAMRGTEDRPLGNVYHMPYPIVFKRLPQPGPSREVICAAMQEIEAQGHFKVELLTVRDSDDRIITCFATLSLVDEDGEFLRTLLDVEGRDELDALDAIERWLNSHGPVAA
jgi:hypothetical protein